MAAGIIVRLVMEAWKRPSTYHNNVIDQLHLSVFVAHLKTKLRNSILFLTIQNSEVLTVYLPDKTLWCNSMNNLNKAPDSVVDLLPLSLLPNYFKTLY